MGSAELLAEAKLVAMQGAALARALTDWVKKTKRLPKPGMARNNQRTGIVAPNKGCDGSDI